MFLEMYILNVTVAFVGNILNVNFQNLQNMPNEVLLYFFLMHYSGEQSAHLPSQLPNSSKNSCEKYIYTHKFKHQLIIKGKLLVDSIDNRQLQGKGQQPES